MPAGPGTLRVQVPKCCSCRCTKTLSDCSIWDLDPEGKGTVHMLAMGVHELSI